MAKKHNKVVFKPYDTAQLALPMEMSIKVPENHLCRVVDSAVEGMDLRHLEQMYKGGGTSSYHPKMMLKLLTYAYTQKIWSSRQIARAVRENIYFMWLARGNEPDFRTLNRFRGQLKEIIGEVFKQLVVYLNSKGKLNLKDYFLDGTKMEANASKYSFVWKKSVEKNSIKLGEKVKALMDEIDRANEIEDEMYGDDDLIQTVKDDPEGIKELIDRLNDKLAGREKKSTKITRKVIRRLDKDILPRARRYHRQLKDIGSNRRSMSHTDKDATFMRMKEDHMLNGQLKPGYNVQIGTEGRYVVDYGLSQDANDKNCLKPSLERYHEAYGKYPEQVIADAGYGSEENYEFMENAGVEAYVKYQSFHQEQKRKYGKDPCIKDNMVYDMLEDSYVCRHGGRFRYISKGQRKSVRGYVSNFKLYACDECNGCPHRSKGIVYRRGEMEVNERLEGYKSKASSLLQSPKGRWLRGQRCIEPEFVFSVIKHAMGFTRFMLKGIKNVTVEAGLLFMAYNLRRASVNA